MIFSIFNFKNFLKKGVFMTKEKEDLESDEQQIEYKTIDSNTSALDIAQILIDSNISVYDMLEISDYLKVYAYHHGASDDEEDEENNKIGF